MHVNLAKFKYTFFLWQRKCIQYWKFSVELQHTPNEFWWVTLNVNITFVYLRENSTGSLSHANRCVFILFFHIKMKVNLLLNLKMKRSSFTLYERGNTNKMKIECGYLQYTCTQAQVHITSDASVKVWLWP